MNENLDFVNQYKKLIALITSFIIFSIYSAQAQELSSVALVTSPAPDWIKPIPMPESASEQEAKTQDGVYYLLVDRQFKVDDNQPVLLYRHLAEKVVNQSGLQSVSNISVNYDPSYETLKWHHLTIIRNGKIIDRKVDAKVATLRREKELENSIYNGRLTANIILADLRVGDIVDYSYTLIGQNPIYAGHFADAEYLQWSVPVGRLHFLLDWGKQKKLNFKAVKTDTPLTTTKVNNRTHYEYDLSNISPIKTNSQTPSWYDPYGRYYFSDIETWREVIEWAIPLYETSIKTSPAIKKVVDDIKAKGGSPSHQAALALHYVQDNVRYLGVEMGKNSHQPSLATDTLNRRYGDCKDKTVLLVTILHDLGIAAAPALVNTDVRQELIQEIPSINAFDHVIVHIKVNNLIYWIDPTREYQKGDLEVLFQANYGYGLVIDKNNYKLIEMKVPRITNEKIVEDFDASGALDEPVVYNINTYYTGYESEVQRSNFLGSNITEKSDQYLNFYKGYYDHIRMHKNISFDDNPISSVFHVSEEYRIQPFWSTDKNKKSTTTFYASGISTALAKPEEIVRVAPYYVRQREIKEIINVKLDDANWGFKDSRFEEKNAFFVFSSVVLFDKEKNQLSLEYYYKTLSDSIAAEDIPAYMAARKKVMDEVEYGIYKGAPVETNAIDRVSKDTNTLFTSFVNKSVWIGVAAFLYFISFIALLNNWYTDKSRLKYLEETKFYPVSPLKFGLLALVTLGLYQVYWFYRNWSYLKRVESPNALPFFRALFSFLWFYPFYRRLVNGEESKDIILLPKAKWFAIALAVIYFLLVGLSSLDDFGIFFEVLTVTICLFLVVHIAKIPQTNDLAFNHNSRWLFRHYLLVVVSLPIFLVVTGQGLGLLPGSEVISGNRLYAHDVRFLKRHKIIPARAQVLYFYSTAALNFHDAGNGFTDKTVFSYWHDDEGKLAIKSVPFSKIDDISENKAVGILEDKTLNLTDDEGDEFNLYLGNSDGKNKVFIQKILAQWQQERGQVKP
jgi:transglutaminase-like putative cysteine protease